MHYVTKGTCSRAIDFDVVDGKVTNTKLILRLKELFAQ